MTRPLSRRLVLESPQRIHDGGGGSRLSWVALGVLWGEITAHAGSEGPGPGSTQSAVTCRIRVRAGKPGSPSRPRPEQRFREGNRVFTIRAVAEADPRGRYLTCFAVEETRS
ncbi:MAG: head-tail adaptor protein [Rhodobacteraceae bacterium]|nr:head-tail adaptor protein [Paracoccaceae bacterium]